MSFYFQHVKEYKRGAHWPNGDSRMCTGCGVEIARGERGRGTQAVLTAVLKRRGSNSKGGVPVAYCRPHIPEEIS